MKENENGSSSTETGEKCDKKIWFLNDHTSDRILNIINNNVLIKAV